MAEPSLEPISFDEFKRILADVLLIEEEKITPEASFFTDLFVDSLRLVEIVLSIEHLGAEIPSELFWELQTVGEAYECYVNHSAARA